YAVCAQGRGHSSRVLAMTETLRARGHEVTFACGGPARTLFESLGEKVVPVPALLEVLDGNRLRFWRTARVNGGVVLRTPAVVRRLAMALERIGPDLVVSDFEPFVPRAAARAGLPMVSLNHQELLTEAVVPTPPGVRTLSVFVRAVIRTIATRRPAHRIVTALTALPLRHPARTTLVGPILRRSVREAVPHRGTHLVAYFNGEHGLDRHLHALAAPGVPVRVYGTRETGQRGPLTFCMPSLDGFLADLATSRGVVTTAGFTLLSESLFLGKPALALPHARDVEQTFNAQLVEALGVGQAVYTRPLDASDVRRFLDAFDGRDVGAASVLPPGHDRAADTIERILGAKTSAPDAPASSVPSLSSERRPSSFPTRSSVSARA
ncbi:MAG TPA: glycosyltransferase family protein, partial [Rhodothermales bacterium]|nr:glycosyltransferase family protein [Rhodothermales bacterium]